MGNRVHHSECRTWLEYRGYEREVFIKCLDCCAVFDVHIMGYSLGGVPPYCPACGRKMKKESIKDGSLLDFT